MMAFEASSFERGVMVVRNGNTGAMLISGGPSTVGLSESAVFLLSLLCQSG